MKLPTGLSVDGDDNPYAPIAEINVTPMVDVMLVLLVIFMVAAPLLAVGVPIDLPKVKAAQLAETRKPIIISLNSKGQAFIADQPVSAGDLPRRLDELAAEDPNRVIYVRGDRNIAYSTVMDTLSVVNGAGFAKVSLIGEAVQPK